MMLTCGTCSACCKRDLVYLTDAERGQYAHEIVVGRAVLARKPDGSCSHLTSHGCGIYETRPSLCRSFDCRVLFRDTPKMVRRMRVEHNPTMTAVYEAGKTRLHTLEQ